MNLYQLRDLIENSSAAQWVKVEPAGVTYRYRFEVSSDRDGGEHVSVDSHRAVAVYTADVNLTMAYGMPEVKGTRWRSEDLGFEWATFPDKRFPVENADIFWAAGAPIHRVNYLVPTVGAPTSPGRWKRRPRRDAPRLSRWPA